MNKENISLASGEITLSPDQDTTIQGSMTVITAKLRNSGGDATTMALHNDDVYDGAVDNYSNYQYVNLEQKVAQSFYATNPISFKLSKISLRCKSYSVIGGELRVELRDNNGGKPAGTYLERKIITATDNTIDWRDATGFTTTLAPGVLYWIVVYSDASDNEWKIGAYNVSTFSRGQVANILQGYSEPDWTQRSSYDLLFRITGSPPILVQFYDGDPTSGGVQISTDSTISAVPNDAFGRNVSVPWRAHPGGDHSIYVKTTYAGIDSITPTSKSFSISVAPPSDIKDLTALTKTGGRANLGAIDLRWTAPGEDLLRGKASGYLLKYSSAGVITNANFDAVPTYPFKNFLSTNSYTAVFGGEKQTITVTGLSRGTTYWFALRAKDNDGPLPNAQGTDTHWSVWYSSTSPDTSSTPYIYNRLEAAAAYNISPNPPTSVVIVASKTAEGLGQINLSWTAPANPEDYIGYRIYCDSMSHSSFVPSKRFIAGESATTKFYHTDLQHFNTYYYRIVTVGCGPIFLESSYSTAVSTSCNPPYMPTGFHGTAVSINTIRWNWFDRANDEQGYRIINSTGGIDVTLNKNVTFWMEPGLSLNTAYTKSIVAYNIYGTSPTVAISTTCYTLANPPIISLPAGPGVDFVTINTVRLAWDSNSNPAPATRYGIIRSTGPGHWTSTTTLKGFSNNWIASNFLDTGLTPNTTYFYKIRAFNGDGIPTNYNIELTTRTNPGSPPTPTNFGGVALSTGSIQWKWVDKSSGTSTEAGFELVKEDPPPPPPNKLLAANVTYWSEPSLSVNSAYTRYVRAYNVTGFSVSASSLIYTLANPPTQSYFLNVGSNSITITWDQNSNPMDNTSWRLLRSLDNKFVNTSTINLVGLAISTYTDTNSGAGLTPMTQYWYKIKAINGNGIGTAYDHILTTTTKPALPKAPDRFGGIALSTGSINWGWRDNSKITNNPKDRELGFEVRQLIPDTLKKTLNADTTFWYEPSLPGPNKLYTRYVKAFNETGFTISASSMIYTLANKPLSSRVAAGLKVSSTTVPLSWSQNSNPTVNPATLYGIFRSSDNFQTDTTTIRNFSSNPPLTGSTFLDTNLLPNTSYWYKLCAYNGNGIPTAFDVVVATKTDDAPPIGPVDFHGLAVSTTSIRWLWTDIATNERGYRVMYKVSGSSDQIKISLPANSTFWWEKRENGNPLTLNTSYYRQLEVWNKLGYNVSNSTIAFTLAHPPTGSYWVSVTSYSIKMKWEANLDPSHTIWGIIRSLDQFSASTVTVRDFSNKLTTLNYTNTGLLPSTTYWYKVRAYNGDGVPTTFDLMFSTVTNPAPPNCPQKFIGTALSTSSIKWAWTKPNPPNSENGFRIRSSTGALVSRVSANTTAYVENKLAVNTRYSRYAESYNITASSRSNTVLRYTLARPPTGSYIINVSPLKVTIGWKVNGNPAYTSFGLVKSTDSFTLSSTTILDFSDTYNTTYYIDTDVVPATTYWYLVCAYNGDGIQTLYDRLISTMTHPGTPKPPADFKGVAVSSTAIKWSWTKSAYADGYYIKDSKGKTMNTKQTLKGDATFYIESSLTYNTSYYRYALAYNITGSSPSLPASRYTLAIPPDFWKTHGSSSTWHTTDITWNRECATRLMVQISTSPTFDVSVTTLTWVNEVSSSPYTVRHLYLGSTYYFGLWGYNGDQLPSQTRTVIKGFSKNLPKDIVKIMPELGGKQTWYALINNTPVKMEAVVPAHTVEIPVYVIITPNAMNNPQLVDTTTINTANLKINKEVNRNIFIPSVTEFNMYDFYGSTVGSWAKDVTITLSYPDVNNDALVDDTATQYKVRNLFMAFLDPFLESWTDVTGHVHDIVNKKLTADVSHFSMYAIVASGPRGGFYARVYPNPFKPNSNLGHTVMTFTSLQVGSTLRVYTMTGTLVYKLENIESVEITWDGTNQSGRKLASGVYIYVLSDKTGATIKDKFAIIR
ncbi:MAG: T9SS type A sorting domain-containing protein [Elusimicrobia bacterium]|nr:T9SS type A sorting domain-containing protein [Candidatus Liberimonas magnetica]